MKPSAALTLISEEGARCDWRLVLNACTVSGHELLPSFDGQSVTALADRKRNVHLRDLGQVVPAPLAKFEATFPLVAGGT